MKIVNNCLQSIIYDDLKNIHKQIFKKYGIFLMGKNKPILNIF